MTLDNIPTRICDTDIQAWIGIIRDTKAQITKLEERLAHARDVVQEHLGDAELGTTPDGTPLVHWTHVTSERIDTKKVRALLDATQLAQVTTITSTRRFVLAEPTS